MSSQVAAGNVLVFAELAPLFSALLDAFGSHPTSAEELAAQLAPALKASNSTDDAATLEAAFSAYGQALFAPRDRAALILRANTLAVAHEQRRLQPAIAAALNAAISDTLQKVIEGDVVGHLPIAEVRHFVDGLTDDVCKVLDGAWDTALTEAIMRLVTASETLDLRRDVPPLSEGLFPPALCDLSGTAAERVVAKWDKTGGTGRPSGAHDWAVLEQRMNFIVNLFRSRQRDGTLFDPPVLSSPASRPGRGSAAARATVGRKVPARRQRRRHLESGATAIALGPHGEGKHAEPDPLREAPEQEAVQLLHRKAATHVRQRGESRPPTDSHFGTLNRLAVSSPT